MTRPSPADWAAYDAWNEHGSALRAAAALGCTRLEVVDGMMRASAWLNQSGWEDAFRESIRWGFSLGEAIDHADQKAAYNMRAER